MNAQPTLFDRPIQPPPVRSAETLADRFEEFDRENPHIYRLILAYARELRSNGAQHAGIALIFERIRWDVATRTRGEEYKMNNSYRAFYVRKIEREHPEFRGFFETRRQHGGENHGEATA